MRRSLIALACASLLLPLAATAQDRWPDRPITLMGGFPNGSGVDIYARKLAEPLSRALGVPVVVDNRSGAGGNIASDFVAKARPDGYTLLFGTAGTHAINATLYRNLPFDPVKDSTPVTHLGDVPNVLTVSAERRPHFTSCAAVVEAAKAAPGKLNYASTGNGASTHLAGAQFIQVAGLDMVHVPFRGQPGAQTALLAGDVDLFFNQSGPAIGYIQQGQVKGLAVTTAQRLPALPDIPTVAEACGLVGFDSSTWYGIFAPPGLPAAIQERLNSEIQRIITAPDFRQWLIQTQGITPSTLTTSAEFRALQIRDIERWAEVVRKSGAQVD
ncbi:Bug family tripartite tricarboxylate transporter substrate binding protein [Teichococcus vastitatis]|uniref:Tripartite tricarboxylate transporter substrate binding protein n=1 Tax=Teichococcus vastitatis TaxID=2307076 RepID=A0ABS9W1L1_9PROT|nr:tripartite tricarboxylate transporter substrate binding protein [Pseudoroseomonas vastitatis]MCI0753187.1 tripartite tricarboxylate transporter substrate binding protein [Pseudoroseomonas vastitatis]